MPPILKVDYEALGVFFGAAGIVVSITFWVLGKMLSNKKDVTELQVEVENLKESLRRVENELIENRKRKFFWVIE